MVLYFLYGKWLKRSDFPRLDKVFFMSGNLQLGTKIRNLRNQSSLTQQELADRTELTKGFISQLERNQTVPSIPTLLDILKCLGTTPAAFFEEVDTEDIVFHKEDFFEKDNEEQKSNIKWLVPSAQGNMIEPILVELQAGGTTFEDKPHEGEEFGYILDGSIRLTLGKASYVVNKGETFYYTADEKHHIEANGERNAKFLWISVPPSF